MIYSVLKLLANELNDYIKQELSIATTTAEVELGNIAMLETNPASLEDLVVMSMVNIQEEKTLRNVPPPFTQGPDNSITYQQAPIHVNLFVLFTANFPTDYENALKRISVILRYFQSRKEFGQTNLVNTEGLTFEPGELHKVRLKTDLYTLSFEQANHLWGTLGGKQLPFVLYRMRVLEIQTYQDQGAGGLIEEVELKT